MAVRASLRAVLERVTLADLASGELPESVKVLAAEYEADIRYPRPVLGAKAEHTRQDHPSP